MVETLQPMDSWPPLNGTVEETLIPLLAAAKAGSREALNEACRIFEPRVRIVVARQLADRQRRNWENIRFSTTGSSLVQLTLMEASRDIGDFVGETPSEFIGWLVKIAVRNCIDADRAAVRVRMRGSSRGRSLDRDMAPHEVDAAMARDDDALDSLERREETERLLGRLGDRDRQLVEMRFLMGLSFRDIAARVGQSADGVRMACRRAINKLRKSKPR